MWKRWAIIPLVLCLLLTGVLPAFASGMTRAERYDATISELRRYFIGEATMTADELSSAFDGLGSYQHSVSFSLYTRVLRDAEAEIFTDAHLWIHQLRRNEAFCAYVADEDNSLAPVDAVESYLLARQAQAEGRTDEAIACYAECITLLDSNARLNALEMQLLEDKYQQALTLMADGTQESLQAAIALWEELAALHYRDSAEQLAAAQRPRPATLPNGHTVHLSLSQYRFTGPEVVNVTINIRNDSDTDAPGPIALYDPSGKRVTDFGTPTLAAGESADWTGTWSVTQEQLDAGRIVFAIACVMPDESGAMTTKFTPFYGAITYEGSILPDAAYVDASGEAVWGTVPTATPGPTEAPTAVPTE